MNNRYYILDTELDAIKCNQECAHAFNQQAVNLKYKQTNKQWSEIQQRATDGKYVVLVCPYLGTFGYTVEVETDQWQLKQQEEVIDE